MLTSKAADAVGHGSSKWGSREGWWGEGRTWGVPILSHLGPVGASGVDRGRVG
jgi:hypothetical protein